MNILGRLALLFVVVPILELVLLIELGQVVGFLPTVALVVFTGVTGAWLARAEGIRVFFQFQRELASGKLPGQALLDGISVLIGGAFLLTPGVITDFVGFSLLLPITRRAIQRRVRKRLERSIADGSVRVVTMGGFGAAGFGGFGGFGAGQPGAEGQSENDFGEIEVGGPSASSRGSSRRPSSGIDPSKGIVIEPED